MNALHLALPGLAAALLLSACGRDEPAVPEPADSARALLAYVPAGTPYLAANLEPLPAEVVDTFLARAQPVLDAMQQELSALRQQLEREDGEHAAESRVLLVLLQELDGKLSRAGLESLGLDLEATQVVYGIGAFPVIRFTLGDAEALRATVDRVMQNTGITVPPRTHGGVSYWQIPLSDTAAQGVAFYLTILDDHLAAGVLPTAEENTLLPQFLGLERPAESDAAERLAAVNQRYGYTPYGTGIIDLEALASELLEQDRLTSRTLATMGLDQGTALSEVCKAEIRALIGHAPTMVMGTTEMTASAIGYQYVAETNTALAGQLMALLADVPMVGVESSRLAELTFGLKFGPVREFLRAAAEKVVNQPFQCPHLLTMNHQARQSFDQLNQPMPPFLNNFNGLRLAVNRFTGADIHAGDHSGLLAVHLTQPEMFVGMAQMFLPNLAGLSLTPGAEPVPLPPDLLPVPGLIAHAALSEEAIGIAVGAGEEQSLRTWLDRKSESSGTFLAVNYDSAAYLRFTRELPDSWQAEFRDSNAGEDHPAGAAPLQSIADAFNDAYAEIADRSYVALGFTEHGFVIDSRMTFK